MRKTEDDIWLPVGECVYDDEGEGGCDDPEDEQDPEEEPNEEEEAASQANGWPPSTTGVAPFRRDYFNCRQSELYADEALATYALLGDRKLKLPWRKAHPSLSPNPDTSPTPHLHPNPSPSPKPKPKPNANPNERCSPGHGRRGATCRYVGLTLILY